MINILSKDKSLRDPKLRDVTTTSFVPLVGPFIIGVDELNKEKDKTFNITTDYIFSFEPFTNNQQHIQGNFPNKIISYLPTDLLPDYSDPKANVNDLTPYKRYIKDNKIKSTDLLLAVPPCAGLSMLNVGNRGAGCAANMWMYETVKWHIAQDNGCLLLENAPGLVGKEGVKVLNVIEKILEDNGVRDDYKIHTTKTSTTYHGLPQQRHRTFLFIYKATEFKRLKNIVREQVLLEDYFKLRNRPEETKDGTNHIQLAPNWSSDNLKWIEKNNYWDRIRTIVDGYGAKTITDFMFKIWREENPETFDEFPKLKKEMNRKQTKLDKGLGYWDSAPIVCKGKTNAIIAKNAFNILHPFYNRFITVREMMDLMGYPDDFELKGNTKKNFNHVCQSVPVKTGMDHIRWAQGIVYDDPDFVDGVVETDATILLQKNMKGDLFNDINGLYKDDIEFVKLKTSTKRTKLKQFLT